MIGRTFLIQSRALFRQADSSFKKKVQDSCSHFIDYISPESKRWFTAQKNDFLNKGREKLQLHQYQEACSNFSSAKRYCLDISYPSLKTWPSFADFAIFSNRATVAWNLRRWNLCRIDIRWTLSLKADHIKSYEKAPQVAKSFSSRELENIFQEIVDNIHQNPRKTSQEWNILANKVIALLSVFCNYQFTLWRSYTRGY